MNIHNKKESLGLGKLSQEMDMARDATANRRMHEAEMEQLDPERVAELRAKWKDAAAKKEAIRDEIKEVRSSFYCEVCDKQ